VRTHALAAPTGVAFYQPGITVTAHPKARALSAIRDRGSQAVGPRACEGGLRHQRRVLRFALRHTPSAQLAQALASLAQCPLVPEHLRASPPPDPHPHPVPCQVHYGKDAAPQFNPEDVGTMASGLEVGLRRCRRRGWRVKCVWLFAPWGSTGLQLSLLPATPVPSPLPLLMRANLDPAAGPRRPSLAPHCAARITRGVTCGWRQAPMAAM
jgi:hypothetical protein